MSEKKLPRESAIEDDSIIVTLDPSIPSVHVRRVVDRSDFPLRFRALAQVSEVKRGLWSGKNRRLLFAAITRLIEEIREHEGKFSISQEHYDFGIADDLQALIVNFEDEGLQPGFADDEWHVRNVSREYNTDCAAYDSADMVAMIKRTKSTIKAWMVANLDREALWSIMNGDLTLLITELICCDMEKLAADKMCIAMSPS